MHRRTRCLASVWVPLTAVWSLAADGGEACRVRVIEGRAAVYVSTNAVREAVAWQPSGTELAVRGELTDEAWVCVEPPPSASVWVYRELVKDGVVLANGCRVRAGAGLAFRPVGGLNKGDRVEVRGAYGDWLKIRPPPAVRFWMLRDQVEPLAEMPAGGPEAGPTNEVAAVAVTNVPAAQAPSAPAAAVALPPELSGFELDDTPGQGAKVVLSGILDWGTVGAVAAPFCLVARRADGDSEPVCHLMAPALTYSPHVGASVRVEGTRWRVKGAECPVVIPVTLRIEE